MAPIKKFAAGLLGEDCRRQEETIEARSTGRSVTLRAAVDGRKGNPGMR